MFLYNNGIGIQKTNKKQYLRLFTIVGKKQMRGGGRGNGIGLSTVKLVTNLGGE
jgi:hypothetical protein